MKRLFLVSSLACAALLLSACPDAKLPTPAPKVPEPKAENTLLYGSPGSSRMALQQAVEKASGCAVTDSDYSRQAGSSMPRSDALAAWAIDAALLKKRGTAAAV
ncbi:MAG: hypothetical protein I8H91_10780 [Burkholderiales bacterium]|nr:hypothetical protein [Burkholderiales bacterium]